MSSSRSNHRARVAPMMLAGFLSGAAPSVLAQSPTPAVAPELTGASTALPAITVVAPQVLEAEPTDAASERRISGETLNKLNVVDLTDLLRFYLAFPIHDHTGDPLAQEDVTAAHYERVQQLQRLFFKHVPKLKELALA